MYTLILDVCFGHDEELDDVIGRLAQGTDIVTTITGVHVAGGWPEVKFVGDALELVTVASRYANDTGDAGEIIARITRTSSM